LLNYFGQKTFTAGRLFFAGLLSLQIAGGCALNDGNGPEPAVAADLQTRGKTLVYECSGYEFIARTGPEEMAVWLEDQYLILPQVRSGSGAKYQEGDVTFWSKGEEAMLTVGRQQFGDCVLVPHRAPWEDARRRGVDFRAVGNEPGWYLEIQHDRHLLFVADYGLNRVLITSPTLTVEEPRTIYQASSDKDELRVEIVDELCTDTMKGDTFTSQVTVYLNGKAYTGCGNSLVRNWK